MKTFFTLTAFWLCLGMLSAQNIVSTTGPTEDLYEAKHHIFEHLNLSALSPGNLWDYGLAWIDISQYDGLTNPNALANEAIKTEFLRFSEGLMVRES